MLFKLFSLATNQLKLIDRFFLLKKNQIDIEKNENTWTKMYLLIRSCFGIVNVAVSLLTGCDV